MRNHYFNPYPHNLITQEQLLVEDLLIEALKIYACDCYYLPRESRDQIDKLYGEDAVKSFNNAYPLEFYIENVLSMEGEMDLMTKFGLEIRDEMTVLVSRRRFKKEVHNIDRPREGDIIYIPFLDNFFEIYSVEHENNQAMFYTLGRGRGANIYVYALKMRQFAFSEEPITTGVELVDESIEQSYKPVYLMLNTGTGNYLFEDQEVVTTATASANVVNWTAATKQLEVILVKGSFIPGQIVVGGTSNASWNIASVDYNSPINNIFEDSADNKVVQNEANTILNWDESNPFGTP